MRNEKSYAVELREKGNESLKAGKGLIQKGEKDRGLQKLVESIGYYRDSIDEANNGLESSSSYKNLGIAYMEICSIKKEERQLREARKSFLMSIKHGKGHQSESWLIEICQKLKNLAEDYFFDEEERVIFYAQVYRSKFEWDCFKPLVELLARELARFYTSEAMEKRERIILTESKATTKLAIKDMVSILNELQSLVNEATFYIVEMDSIGSTNFKEEKKEMEETIAYEKKSIKFLKALYNSRYSFERGQYWDSIDIIQSFISINDVTLYEAWGKEIIAECLMSINQEIYKDQIRELMNEAVAFFVSNGAKFDSYYYKKAREVLQRFQEKEKEKNDEKARKEQEELLKDPIFKGKLDKLNQIALEEPSDVFVKKLFEFFPNPKENGEIHPCPPDVELTENKIKNTLTNVIIPIYGVNFNMKGKYPLPLYREVNQLLVRYVYSKSSE